jgi:hypothetical protein
VLKTVTKEFQLPAYGTGQIPYVFLIEVNIYYVTEMEERVQICNLKDREVSYNTKVQLYSEKHEFRQVRTHRFSYIQKSMYDRT